MVSLIHKKKCEVCKRKLTNELNLGKHPMCDDLIPIKSKKKSKLYPIKISLCSKCLTVTQKVQIPKNTLFPKNYHYRAELTKDVVQGQKKLVTDLEKLFGNLKGKVILDIGANDFTLLDFFKKKNSITIGVEPTNAIKDASKHHYKYQDYFNKKLAVKIKKKFKKIDYITFTNVFAHIEDLDQLLHNLKILISDKTLLIIENHYLGSILKLSQFDTFYSEHPRTYSLKSFSFIAKKLGLKIFYCSFPKRYGGNIRVILSKKKSLLNKFKIESMLKSESMFFKEFKNLKRNIKIWKLNKMRLFKSLNGKFGPLPAKAFPGRAAILIKLLDLNENNISAIYEKNNSMKIGNYAPGTRIKIKSDSELRKLRKEIPIINLAWHIPKEIKSYLKSLGLKNKVIDIVQKKDFKI